MESALLQELAQIPTGNLSDALGKIGSMDESIKPVFQEARMAGPAFTASLVPGDNLGAHIALNQAPAGSVLVLDAKGYCGGGLFGEIMSLAAQKRGLAGVVIDGACRDSQAITQMGYPVFSRAVNPGGTVKESLGRINVPVSCGGVAVNPGDVVVGDADGVIVIPQDKMTEILAAAKKISLNEAKVMERLRAGESTMEIFHFQKLVTEKRG